MKRRVGGWLLLLSCLGADAAAADGPSARRPIDVSRKRVAERHVLRGLYTRVEGRPYVRRVRRNGTVALRRIWRRRRLGRPKVTQDLPGFLQRLEAWRASRRRTGGAR
jgi:hypothetical protein